MMPYINMLGSAMQPRIFGDIDSTHIVTEQSHDFLSDIIFFKHLLHPEKLCTTTPSCYYSASAVDKDTQFCFLLNHDTRLFPRKKHPPDVLFLSSALPAQSASQYPVSKGEVPCVYSNP